ncbi:MAG: protein-glutamate O-methyltransferase CheR [Spirochaetes bacterium]|nr:protein-glutamate O-methyltransferase CheR [Spirochaetota bacterium]
MDNLYGLRELREEDFLHFKNVIFQETGIKLSDMKKALVQSRLLKRLRELKLDDYNEYSHYLDENYQDEVINLINCITTNKTDFFREPAHFDILRERVLPEFDSKKKDSLKVWSAGCSTGEEPYTLAITILEYYRGKQMPDVKILASDIDTQVLAKGIEGIYRAESVDSMDMTLLKRYFLRGKGANEGCYRTNDILKRVIYFRRLNLQQETYPMKGLFDVIFCRNVIIYFDFNTRKALMEKFYRYLHDGGYLFLGHSETLSGLTDHFQYLGNTVYKKAAGNAHTK